MAGYLQRIARLPLSRHLVIWLIVHMSFLIPTKRLRETDALIAFYHPSPAYPTHILILPKRPYATLLDLEVRDSDFLEELIATVQLLVKELHLENGYRLIVNGGEYQEMPQLHFHLVSGKKAT